MDPDTAIVSFQLITPTPASEELREYLNAQTQTKLLRMDPTGLSQDWIFNIGPKDPTPAEILGTMNTCLSQLTQGDESTLTLGPSGAGSLWYCKVGRLWACYSSSGTLRSQASEDSLWGGENGINSPIALEIDGCMTPLQIVYSFAREFPGDES